MARPKKKQIKQLCKYCSKDFYTVPSKVREFCSGSCAQKYKGIDLKWLDKRKKTCLAKYGKEVAFTSPQVQALYKANMIKKHGVSNPFSLKSSHDKAKKTNLKKYGVEFHAQTVDARSSVSKRIKGRVLDRTSFVNIKWDKILNYCNITELEPLFTKEYLDENKVRHEFGNKFRFKCLKCEEITEVSLSGGYLPTCKCSNYKGYSLIEEEIYRFLLDHFEKDEICLNRRDLIKNRMEIDIYIPSNNFAIEVNGIYWHSESLGKYKNYHLDKTKQCNMGGINLLHILDHEWLFKKPIVQSIILSKLGLIKNKIFARKCIIKSVIDTKIIRSFLDSNHIQGYTHASTSLGLYYKDELVSLMTFSKNRFAKNSNEIELVRFCNKLNTSVVGGASKLFKHFQKTNKLPVISFADRRFSLGKLYPILGFMFDKFTDPSYFYWKNNKILNRMSCQKHKLSKLLEKFDPNKTEYQNMLDNGYKRVWDCGNYKFTYR